MAVSSTRQRSWSGVGTLMTPPSASARTWPSFSHMKQLEKNSDLRGICALQASKTSREE